jgi:predicted nucleotidyltransferase
MLLDEIHHKKTDIEHLASEYGVLRIRVFGSVARGEEKSDSDIDFLVDFPRGYDLFRQRIPLAEKLQQLFNRSVDLIPEHELSPYLRDQILTEAVEL